MIFGCKIPNTFPVMYIGKIKDTQSREKTHINQLVVHSKNWERG